MGHFDRNMLPDPASYFEGEGLTLKGPGKWKTTRCEFHGGSDSMRINAETGAWVCMACGEKGGDVLAHYMQTRIVDFIDAVKDLGAYVDDDKPFRGPVKPAGLSPRAALEVLRFEGLVTWVAAKNLAHGHHLTGGDLERLHLAAQRIQAVTTEVPA